MKKQHTRYWAVLLAILAAVLACLPTAALGARTIRIGYADLDGFLYTDADGNHSGYLYDLLMECSQGTGRSYSFTRIRADDSYDMLRSGQIDLSIGISASVTHWSELTYSTETILSAPMALAVLPTSPIGYGEYSQMENIRVGAYATGYSDSLIHMLFSGKGVQVQLRTDYESRQAMLADLENGQLDAVLLSTDLGITGLRVVDMLGERNLLAATLADGDRTLLNELDEALRELRLFNPDILEEIDATYRLVDDNMYPSLTHDELSYIRRGRAIKVAVAQADMLDSSTAKRSVQQVLDEISLKTGLTFTYVVRETENAALEAVHAGKADMMLGFNNDYHWAQERGVRQTIVYLENTYRFLRKPETREVRTVAVEEGSYIAYRLQQEKRYNLATYADTKACIAAVMDGQVDAALCWTPDAEQTLYELGAHGLVYNDRHEYGGDVCIAVSKMSSYRLLPVLNKTIGCIRPARFRAIALPMVSEVYSDRQQVQTRRLTLALMITLLVTAAALITLAFWIARRLKNASLQVKARTDYLRFVAEEIRHPSQTILGLAAGGTRLTRADSVQALTTAGNGLGELAAEIEVMNQLDDRTFALAPVPVRPEELFTRLCDYIRTRTENRGVQLELRLPEGECPVVLLDEERYRRVCFNLLDNALRRTEAGGTIQLAFQLDRDPTRKNRKLLVLSIGDDGAMLSKQFVKRIAEEPNHDTERTLGLRLMTAKRIVQAMAGEMSVHQRPNAGMKIRAQVPVELAEPLQIMSLSRGVYGGKGLLAGRNILLAEENPVTAQLLYSLLVNEGAHVDLVQNGQQVLDRFLDSAPAYYHALLMDTHLPGVSGTEAARTIRDLPRRDGCSVLIVGMRSGAAATDPEAAKAMNLILPKPINTATLCRRLHTWLGEST